MASQAESYQHTYNSFSGVDMAVVADNRLLAEIQGISYTVTREKAPIYTMGSADPRSFSRGKRGIAGSMIFMVFDRSALLDSLKQGSFARYLANTYEVSSAEGADQQAVPLTQEQVFGETLETTPSTTVRTAVRDSISGVVGVGKAIATARYHDQVLPFSVVLTAANEYGHIARMVIHGVEIMNCGSGLSIDDITTDESCTFVATSIIPWHRQNYVNPRSGRVSEGRRPDAASASDGILV